MCAAWGCQRRSRTRCCPSLPCRRAEAGGWSQALEATAHPIPPTRSRRCQRSPERIAASRRPRGGGMWGCLPGWTVSLPAVVPSMCADPCWLRYGRHGRAARSFCCRLDPGSSWVSVAAARTGREGGGGDKSQETVPVQAAEQAGRAGAKTEKQRQRMMMSGH